MADNPLSLTPAQHHMFFSDHLKKYNVFPKGRRFGATRGASVAFIKWMCDGDQCLWGDTINSNIDRYVDRYFKPALNKGNIPYHWNSQKKLLEVGNGFTDFRSADRPENWEGFGYKKIFLNEAGIILDNEYLYNNAVMPMMLDFPDSQLIAAGTPKLLKGKGRFFHDLWRKTELGVPNYHGYRFTTYDNPHLSPRDIKELEGEIPPNEREQEIYGKFMVEGGNIVQLEWFLRYQVVPQHFERVVHSWDTAYKPQQINDPSVCTAWGQSRSSHFLTDVYRGWIDYPTLKRTVISLAERDNPHAILIEDKASGQSLIQELRADTRLPVVPIMPTVDKVTRMSTASLTIASGNCHIPASAPWLPAYETEIAAFPQGETDDQVDSTSQYLNWARKPQDILIG